MESHRALYHSNLTEAWDDALRQEIHNLIQKDLLSPDAGDSRSTNENNLSHAHEDEDLQCRSSSDVDPQTGNHPHEMNEIWHDENKLGKCHPL